MYDGGLDGNRYTTLTEINKKTVSRLAPRWIFSIPGTSRLEVTPIVADGIMYVSVWNDCMRSTRTGRQSGIQRRPELKV